MSDYRSIITEVDGAVGILTLNRAQRHNAFDDELITELTAGGLCENVVSRLPEMERWTLYHTRGPQERHLCQLDYVLLSKRLAETNAKALPTIVRGGQPYRTPFPPGQEPVRYPRIGWDRPKASDHCPVAITLDMA